MKQLVSVIAATLLAILLTACGGGSSSTGTVRVNLSDAPACGYDHVFITVDHLAFSKDDGASWVKVAVDEANQRFDLLDLQNGVFRQLAKQALAAGTYQQVRLVLKDNGQQAPWANAVVPTSTGTETALKTPSAQQSGYKIKGPFTVAPDTLVDLDLDFNACQSVVRAGNSGQINLKPVVRAVARVVSGSIEGSTTPGAWVYAHQAGSMVSATIADAQGQYRLTSLIESANDSTYAIVVVPQPSSARQTMLVQQVPVVAGQATALNVDPAKATLYTLSGNVQVNTTPVAASLRVSQTPTDPAIGTYQVASADSDPSSGAYTFNLPAQGPQIGQYSGSNPIVYVEDTAVAGMYTVSASDADGNTAQATGNIASGDTDLPLTLTAP